MTRFKTTAISATPIGGKKPMAYNKGAKMEYKHGAETPNVGKKKKKQSKSMLYMQKGRVFPGRDALPGEKESVRKSIDKRDALVKKNVDRKNKGSKKNMTEKYAKEKARLNDSVANAHMKSRSHKAIKKDTAKGGKKQMAGGKMKYSGGGLIQILKKGGMACGCGGNMKQTGGAITSTTGQKITGDASSTSGGTNKKS